MKFIIPENRVNNVMVNYLNEDNDKRLPQNHPMIKAIKGSFGKEPYEFETNYSAPYSLGDEYVDAKIIYTVPVISIWKDDNHYKGTIYIFVEKILLSLNDDVEQVYKYYDVPTWIWDDIQDKLLEDIENWNLPVSVDFEIGGLK